VGHGWMRMAAWGLVTVLATPAVAQLDEELVGDRPDVSESATTVSAGRFQLEAGVLYVREEGETVRDLGQALLRVGLAEDWELRVGLGSWLDAGAAEGWDGGSVGVKVHLLDNWELRPDVALLLGTSTPFGDEEVADDAWQPEAKLAMEWELTDALGLAVNAGYARPGEGGDRFDQAQWSTALGWSIDERFGAFGEYFGVNRDEPGGDSVHGVDAGVTWLLTPDLQLDVWGGTGIGDDGPDWFAGTGVVARW
jgi:hypothetical protein